MVEIERILLSSLAHASTVRSLGHAADHEAPIRTHLDEFEAVDEVLQVAQGASTWALSGVLPAGSSTVYREFKWLKPAPPPTMNSQASTRESKTGSPSPYWNG